MFVLHPRLAADTVEVLRLPLSELRLMNDARFPWLILVPMRAGVTELHALEAADRARLTAAISEGGRRGGASPVVARGVALAALTVLGVCWGVLGRRA